MKSFNQFYEEASLSTLAQRHAQSPEGRAEERKSARERAKSEARKRESTSQRFTSKSRRKSLAKKRETEARLAQQQQNAQELSAQRAAQQARANQKAQETGRNVRHAVKGIYKVGKITVKKVKQQIKKRKSRSQSGT